MVALPSDGSTGWGDTLNAYITSLTAEANSTQTGLNAHAANSPADPHGDRAYASSLTTPITTGTNAANGYVKLNSDGFVPASLVSGSSALGGMYSGIYDAVTMFGATPGTGSDQSVAIQNALNAASANGGGIVYIGPGIFAMASYIVMPSNVWLQMSTTTTLQRIVASTNSPYLITNVPFTSGGSAGTNLRISGGILDAYGSQSVNTTCTPIFIIQSNQTIIEDISTYTPFNNCAIEINGCQATVINNAVFSGNPVVSTNPTVPAVRINSSSTSTTPAGLPSGLYNDAIVTNFTISNSGMSPASAGGSQAWLVGSDKVAGGGVSNHENISVNGCYANFTSGNANLSYILNPNWSNYSIDGNTFASDIPKYKWNDLRPLINSFTGSVSGEYPPQYMVTDGGIVHVFGTVGMPGSYNSVTWGTIPLAPTHIVRSPVLNLVNGSASLTSVPFIQVDTSGNIQFKDLPPGLGGTTVAIDFWYPYRQSGVALITS